jgi:hypothetical protein
MSKDRNHSIWTIPQVNMAQIVQVNAILFIFLYHLSSSEGHAVVQLVEAMCYKLEGCGSDSQWGHWIVFNLPNPSSHATAQPLTEILNVSDSCTYLSSSQLYIHVYIQDNGMYGMFHEPPQSSQQAAPPLAPACQCSVFHTTKSVLMNMKELINECI